MTDSECAELAWMVQLAVLVRITSSRGASLVVIADLVELPARVRGDRCHGAPWSAAAFATCEERDTPCARPTNESRALSQPMRAALESFAREHAAAPVAYLDVGSLLCDESECGTLIPGTDTIGIFDHNHLSDAGSFYMWPHLRHILLSRGLL